MEFRRARKVRSPVSIAPLVDIVFLLLIFFLLSSSFQNPAIKLALPEAEHQAHMEPRPITVTLDENRTLFLNTDRVAFDEYPDRLQALMAQTGARDLIFKGDKSIPYEMVIHVMSLSKKAGAEHINLSHRYVP